MKKPEGRISRDTVSLSSRCKIESAYGTASVQLHDEDMRVAMQALQVLSAFISVSATNSQ
jgi:hypothetical protein